MLASRQCAMTLSGSSLSQDRFSKYSLSMEAGGAQTRVILFCLFVFCCTESSLRLLQCGIQA